MIATFKEFSFEAAHAIPPHSDVHGHSFRVCVEVGGQADEEFGWTVSLYDLEKNVDSVREQLDHRYLNSVEGLSVPSLENLARWIWTKLEDSVPGLQTITVSRGLPGQAEGCTYRGHSNGDHSHA